jgi:DNA-binding IclR family transcriptional regulator
MWIAERGAAGASDVAREFGVPLPTVHHVLSTLVAEGLLEKDSSRRYRMGPGVAVLAEAYLRGQDVPEAWRRALTNLAAATGESAHLAAWHGEEIRILVGIEGSRAVRVPDIHIGAYAHAHARAAGKVLLAGVPKVRRDAYLARHPPVALTARTITDRGRLDAELDRVAQRGYGTDSEEFADGLSCLSVPLRSQNAPLAVFTIAAAAQRLRAERTFLLSEVRRAAAEALSSQVSATAARTGRR